MSKDIGATHSIPIVVDTGRTNFRVGYGGDRNPKSVNPTVYWKDAIGQIKFSTVPSNQSVPVYSLFSQKTTPSQQFSIEDHCSSMVADHDLLLDFIN